MICAEVPVLIVDDRLLQFFRSGNHLGKVRLTVDSGGGPRQEGGKIATNIIQDEGGQESSEILSVWENFFGMGRFCR